MMRVFWEEWREGRGFSLRRGLPVMALFLAAGLAALGLQPGVFFEVLAGGLIVAGLWSGTQRWNQIPSWVWIAEAGVTPAAYTLGKAGGFVLLVGFWMVFVSPVLVLLMVLWGMPWGHAAVCLAWAVAGGLAAQALAHLGTWGPSAFSRLAGSLLVILWLMGFSVAPLVRVHPLWQIYRLHEASAPDADPGAWWVLMAAVAGIWCVVGALQQGRKPR